MQTHFSEVFTFSSWPLDGILQSKLQTFPKEMPRGSPVSFCAQGTWIPVVAAFVPL